MPRQADPQEGETLSLLKHKKISQVWWQVPVIPAIQEAEAGELLEPGRQSLQWAEIMPLHSSHNLCDISFCHFFCLSHSITFLLGYVSCWLFHNRDKLPFIWINNFSLFMSLNTHGGSFSGWRGSMFVRTLIMHMLDLLSYHPYLYLALQSF